MARHASYRTLCGRGFSGVSNADWSIPADPGNPGHFLACLGILRILDTIDPVILHAGRFEDGRFFIGADLDPFEWALWWLGSARVEMHIPPFASAADRKAASKWEVDSVVTANSYFGRPAWDENGREYKKKPSAYPARLHHGDVEILLWHWADPPETNYKLWAGSGGLPGACILHRLLLAAGTPVEHRDDPLNFGTVAGADFRLDPRGTVFSDNAGFSINAHPKIEIVGYPLTEVLGAIGLQGARPRRNSRLSYSYAVAEGEHVRPIFDGVASRGNRSPAFDHDDPLLLVDAQQYNIDLRWVGLEGHARGVYHVSGGLRQDMSEARGMLGVFARHGA